MAKPKYVVQQHEDAFIVVEREHPASSDWVRFDSVEGAEALAKELNTPDDEFEALVDKSMGLK